MTPEERERTNWLVMRIQQEKDQGKFLRLVQELNDLIDKKAKRFVDAENIKKHSNSS